MDSKQKFIINLSISLAIFVAIFYIIGADKIINSLMHARFEFIILALVAYILVNLLMSLRIKVVLDSISDELSTLKILPSSLAGMFASDFTPARVGYFFTAFSLSSRFKIPLEKTTISIFGPQLFDFLIKAVSASVLFLFLVDKLGAGNLFVNLVDRKSVV